MFAPLLSRCAGVCVQTALPSVPQRGLHAGLHPVLRDANLMTPLGMQARSTDGLMTDRSLRYEQINMQPGISVPRRSMSVCRLRCTIKAQRNLLESEPTEAVAEIFPVALCFLFPVDVLLGRLTSTFSGVEERDV